MSPEYIMGDPVFHPEEITVNNRFQLFSPENTLVVKTEFEDETITTLQTIKLLDTGVTPPMLVGINAVDFDLDTVVISPFTSDFGYTITMEDLDLDKRVAKLAQSPDMRDSEDWRKAPLSFFVDSVDNLHLRNMLRRFGKQNDELYDIISSFSEWALTEPNARNVLNSMRFQILSPFAYEGQLNRDVLEETINNEQPTVFYDSFYPLDLGPLPTTFETSQGVLQNVGIPEGYPMNVPDDPAVLSSLEGRFTLQN